MQAEPEGLRESVRRNTVNDACEKDVRYLLTDPTKLSGATEILVRTDNGVSAL